ncbi:MAG: YeeE/YedE family protein [Chloroflexi bacterium]|nr:YeeE/YedE family protein [Chloroflexota bacterium]
MAVAVGQVRDSSWLRQAGLGALGLLVAAVIYVLNRGQADLVVMWLFGLAFGFVLQRSRFCFASSFRDLWLFRNGRVMRAVLLGMAVATLGFALAMYNLSPTIITGRYPLEANVAPLGFHTVVAGLLFGFGMVLAGGCLSGSLYRVGEGYVGSLVALGGVLVGFFLLSRTWGFWWDTSVSYAPRIWLPHYVGWSGGIVLTLLGLLLAYLLVLWWEGRSPARAFRDPELDATPAQDTFGAKVKTLLQKVFVNAWPVLAAGALLGFLNTLEYLYAHPWGVTGEMFRWMDLGSKEVGLTPGALTGLGDIGGTCNIGGAETKRVGLTHGTMINVGIVLGSFVAANLAGEFKIRVPRQPKRYVQAVIGGILMGYGAALALGCTLGAFFSAAPSLGVNAWGFALGLLVGSFVGVRLIKKLG